MTVREVHGARATGHEDLVAIEEPLELRIEFETAAGSVARTLSVTMRTPGNDYALAVGFLFAEGVISGRDDVRRMDYCVGRDPSHQEFNSLSVSLRAGLTVGPALLLRHFLTYSSCGVCGRAALDALRARKPPVPAPDRPRVPLATLYRLRERVLGAQEVFARTGGLHAAALFDPAGNLVALHEDLGRHNAVDKVIGTQVLEGRTPLADDLLWVSGRSSFEIVQKAVVAGLPIVAAVGAPSSLAIDVAEEFGLTLLGFLHDDRVNIYTGAQRVELAEQ